MCVNIIQFKSKEKITMEITEIDKLSTGQNVSMEEIVNSIKEETKPITLWGLSNSYDDISVSDEDEDATPILSKKYATVCLEIYFPDLEGNKYFENKNCLFWCLIKIQS